MNSASTAAWVTLSAMVVMRVLDASLLLVAASVMRDLSSSHAFDGESASNQSNSLQGSITVTIAKVFPGGNLYIQGEKWIQINQGNEYIRLRGIIRPVDISTTNTIVSTKIADARISYGGTGATADVTKVGWLSRFFISPIWPFSDYCE
jgi:flagellar L-ring protein precursor FlgH